MPARTLDYESELMLCLYSVLPEFRLENATSGPDPYLCGCHRTQRTCHKAPTDKRDEARNRALARFPSGSGYRHSVANGSLSVPEEAT